MESKTLNQIFAIFESFAVNHPQIHSYDLGTELKLTIKDTEQFTKMFVLIGPAVWNNPSVAPSFQFQILDRVLTDKQSNKWYFNETMSDTFQIATDLVSHLKYNRLISNGTSVTFNPQVYQQDPVLAGWSFNIDLSTDIRIQNCHLLPDDPGFAIRMITANSEFLKSKGTQYLPASTNGLDIEFTYSGFSQQDVADTMMSFSDAVAAGGQFLLIRSGTSGDGFIRAVINAGSGDKTLITNVTTPASGKIGLKGDATKIDLLLDDVVIATINEVLDLSGLVDTFTAGALTIFDTESQFMTWDLQSIKVQNKTWDFPEGSGSETQSNEGDVLNLNTTGSVDDMWIPK